MIFGLPLPDILLSNKGKLLWEDDLPARILYKFCRQDSKTLRLYNLNWAIVGRFAESPIGFSLKMKIRLVIKASLKIRESLNSGHRKIMIKTKFLSIYIQKLTSFLFFNTLCLLAFVVMISP